MEVKASVSAAVAALVSAVTSLTVAVVSLTLALQKAARDERAQRAVLNSGYLNPLRLHLAENHFRLSDTLRRIEAHYGLCNNLLVIDDPADVSEKDPSSRRVCRLAAQPACRGVRSSRLSAEVLKWRKELPPLWATMLTMTRLHKATHAMIVKLYSALF